MTGKCSGGASCKYAHIAEELRGARPDALVALPERPCDSGKPQERDEDVVDSDSDRQSTEEGERDGSVRFSDW